MIPCANCGHELGERTPFNLCDGCYQKLKLVASWRPAARMLSTVDDAAHDFRLRDAGYRRADALERQQRIEQALQEAG